MQINVKFCKKMQIMRKNVRKCQKMHEFLTFFAFVTNYLAFSHIFPHCLHFFAELDISLHFLASCGNGPNSPAWHFFEVAIFFTRGTLWKVFFIPKFDGQFRFRGHVTEKTNGQRPASRFSQKKVGWQSFFSVFFNYRPPSPI